MRAIAALLGVCLLSACGPWLEDFDLRNSGRMSFDTVEGEKSTIASVKPGRAAPTFTHTTISQLKSANVWTAAIRMPCV
jgi:hypothetical protein